MARCALDPAGPRFGKCVCLKEKEKEVGAARPAGLRPLRGSAISVISRATVGPLPLLYKPRGAQAGGRQRRRQRRVCGGGCRSLLVQTRTKVGLTRTHDARRGLPAPPRSSWLSAHSRWRYPGLQAQRCGGPVWLPSSSTVTGASFWVSGWTSQTPGSSLKGALSPGRRCSKLRNERCSRKSASLSALTCRPSERLAATLPAAMRCRVAG